MPLWMMILTSFTARNSAWVSSLLSALRWPLLSPALACLAWQPTPPNNGAKEIGIRKVLGAGVSTIVGMLSIDFIKLVVISILLAGPLAWWAHAALAAGICL